MPLDLLLPYTEMVHDKSMRTCGFGELARHDRRGVTPVNRVLARLLVRRSEALSAPPAVNGRRNIANRRLVNQKARVHGELFDP